MSSTLRMWMEVAFNLGYLTIVWILVVKMLKRMEHVAPQNTEVARSMMLAFFFLAIGDTGHVGFRVLAYFLGGLGASIEILGKEFALVGAGALSTAVTITIFYITVLDAWRKRYNKQYGFFEYTLIVAAIARFILFIHPGNQWGNVVPPFEWSLVRNIPLMLQGFGVAYLILGDSIRQRDKAFVWIGLMILVSYGFYLPVILLVQKSAWVGMLMIPKTLAYLAIAVIAYQELFQATIKINIKSFTMNK